MSRLASLFLAIVVLAGCAASVPASQTGEVPCELVPLAREIPMRVRDGMAAARAGNHGAAALAADRLKVISSRILAATAATLEESALDYLVAFWTAAYTADQVAFLLSDVASDGPADAEELASLASMEATIAKALDQSVQAIEDQATNCS